MCVVAAGKMGQEEKGEEDNVSRLNGQKERKVSLYSSLSLYLQD